MKWPEVPLKQVAHVRTSSVDKKSVDGQPTVRLCNYVDVYHRDTITADQDFMPATATPEQVERFGLRPGDVIITKDSETPEDIGVAALVSNSAPDLVCGYHLALLRPRAAVIDSPYLYWAMSSGWLRGQLAARATGVTRFGLRSEVIANARVPLPAIDEQQRIAGFLDAESARIARLADLKRRLLTRLPLRTQGVMHAALATMPRTGRLAYAVSWLSGGTPPRVDLANWSGEVPWASTKDLSRDRLDDAMEHVTPEAAKAHSTMAPAGSVLVATRGMSLAKRLPLAVIERPMAFNQDLKALVPGPQIRSDYLRLVLRAFEGEILSHVVEAAHGTRRLETKDLKMLKFPMPSPGQQRSIVDQVREVETGNDALARRLHQQLALLKERREALITAAVTGQLDPSTYRTSVVAA